MIYIYFLIANKTNCPKNIFLFENIENYNLKEINSQQINDLEKDKNMLFTKE